MLRVIIGTLLGAIPGLIFGVLLGLSPILRAFIQPAINALYPVPKIAMFPLIMMIFGIGETSKWIIVAVAVFFQMFFSTLAGVVNIDKIYLDVASNFKANRWQTYWTIAMPGALPFIFTGLQLGVGMALIVVIIAENFGTQGRRRLHDLALMADLRGARHVCRPDRGGVPRLLLPAPAAAIAAQGHSLEEPDRASSARPRESSACPAPRRRG